MKMKVTEVTRYFEHPNIEFKGNPLNQFMPYLDHERMRTLLHCPITFLPEERSHSAELRIQYIARLKEYFKPRKEQVSFAVKVWNAFLQGNKQRNPVAPSQSDVFYDLCNQLAGPSGYISQANHLLGAQTYIVLMGTPGCAKTRLFKALSSRIPRLIYHKELSVYQLPILILSSPGKGMDSKTLPFAIYTALYEAAVAAGIPAPRAGIREDMRTLKYLAKSLAIALNLGLLVIDEIQHILRGTEGADNLAMKFLTDLVNEFPAPIAIVGTWQMAQLAQLELRLGRRSISLESAVFRRLPRGDEYVAFVKDMFQYQFIQNPAEPTADILDEIYYHTQGIEDLIVKLFMICQLKAIELGHETITAEFIDVCARKHLVLVAPQIRMMREGMREDDPFLYDLEPANLDAYIDLLSAESEMKMKNRGRKGVNIKVLAKLRLARSLVTGEYASETAAVAVADSVVDAHPKASPAEHLVAALAPAIRKGPRITASTKLTPQRDAQFEELEVDDLRRIAYFAHRGGRPVAEVFQSRGLLPSRVDELLEFH